MRCKRFAALLTAVLVCLFSAGAALADGAYLTVVSSASPADAAYVPDGLTPIVARRNALDGSNANGGVYVSASGTVEMCAPAAEALTAMFRAAEADGVVLYLRQGYRSFAAEERRYARMKDQPDAVPAGQSDYQTGLAATVVGPDWRSKTPDVTFAESAEYAWLKASAASFGFVERYPQGKEAVTGCAWSPWHLRYVGDAAPAIAASGLALEEYVALSAAPEAAEPEAAESAEPEVTEPEVTEPEVTEPEAAESAEPAEPEPTATPAPVAAPAATPVPLPVVSPDDYAAGLLPPGPVVLDVATSDGDTELILFHD